MATFYEVIVRVPFDVEEHLPGISDSFVDWVTGQIWELPPESDLNLTLIEQPQLTVADRIRRVFLYEWNKFSKQESKFFVQFEKGSEYFHLHTLVETCGYAPWDALKCSVEHADVVYYDLKLLNDALHERYTGQSNRLILDNLTRLSGCKF